ncbi:MAG: GNAT family N-acetyltransferase [Clostridia bacterium]|nr:GNAT family N-acetyltransferase [Clostridia bacterium]
MSLSLIKLRERPELADRAAQWFHEKWGIPLIAYQESIAECVKRSAPVPQWYIALDGDLIAGGLGVIENDFHQRKDLAPNVCALYVEKSHRGNGLAGELLNLACTDLNSLGIDTLYLLTDHTSFYERHGWSFFCMAKCDGEDELSRVYVKRTGG